jgi:uncharacterized repeat protein (TIGR03803 family)
VFKLTPAGKGSVLYSFCAKTDCTDGKTPEAGLIMDAAGDLYGTTTEGGFSVDGFGIVFKVTPAGKESMLHSFCSVSCADGAFPLAGLILDKAGNLFGTTSIGGGPDSGVYKSGTVFEVTPTGKESVLYSFCANKFVCNDGRYPIAGLIMDETGNLYGTTWGGGAYNRGTVFELIAN